MQKQIRKDKRQARQEINKTVKQQKSAMICDSIINHPAYQTASKISAYLAMPEEVSVKAIIEDAWAADKQVYLPVVMGWGKSLMFAPYYQDSELVPDSLGIKIPNVKQSDYISANQLDFVVTPLVAFDKTRNRIGMGGGFYDRTFAFTEQSNNTFLAGVAFIEQLVDEGITENKWDIKPTIIVSDKSIFS